MIHVVNTSNDPFFNHAIEEYFLSEYDEEIFTIWINRPSILIGRNQNTFAEINSAYVSENNIDVVRRLSGGGAVYNDLGNMNFTFISKKSDDHSFSRFASPVIDALKSLDVDAQFTGRNDITIEGKKISGNAQYFYEDKVLHHGTLLYDVKMDKLTKALNTHPLKFQNKAVKSVSSRVANISDYLENKMDLHDFKTYLENYIKDTYSIKSSYTLTSSDIEKIEEIAQKRFRTASWNFGKNTSYNISSSIVLSSGILDFNLTVKNNIIYDFKIFGDFFGEIPIEELETMFLGLELKKEKIHNALNDICICDFIMGLDKESFISALIETTLDIKKKL